jgi:hypothetical protein
MSAFRSELVRDLSRVERELLRHAGSERVQARGTIASRT